MFHSFFESFSLKINTAGDFTNSPEGYDIWNLKKFDLRKTVIRAGMAVKSVEKSPSGS